MTGHTLREQYLYGKPVGSIEVVDPDGRVVMTFRKRLGEHKASVRKRAQDWLDGGMQGVPGAPPGIGPWPRRGS